MTSGAEKKRRHVAGQRNIVRYCICGRAIVGNVGWWSHMNAHPDDSWNHRRITSVEWQRWNGDSESTRS